MTIDLWLGDQTSSHRNSEILSFLQLLILDIEFQQGITLDYKDHFVDLSFAMSFYKIYGKTVSKLILGRIVILRVDELSLFN
jgi:hypothetical protein